MDDAKEKSAQRFIEWLYENDLIISYWNPARNELMPILITGNGLAENYAKGKKPVGGPHVKLAQ
jgi:hypothetical protein